MITIAENESHKNLFFSDLTSGHMVDANQHVILDGQEAMLLDPGGHKVHTKLFSRLSSVVSIGNIKHIFFSHQDPDIIAAANAWLMVTDAQCYLSALWMRFISHFGVDELVYDRIQPIPDEGRDITLGATTLKVLPAHYLHSAGNFSLYDPAAKILYSGDIGASFGHEYQVVEDFDSHVKHMQWFHQRYLPCSRVVKLYVNTIRDLDIEVIAPQHGAIFKGKEMCRKFLSWLEALPCGIDVMGESYRSIQP